MTTISSTSTAFFPASYTGTGPSQGAVLSHSSQTRVYIMYYGTKSSTFTPTPYPREESGTYHLTKPVKITKPEVVVQGNTVYRKATGLPQTRIYGNTTSEMSVYKPGNNTAAAWYSPTQGKTVTSSTYCPTCR